MCAIAGILDIRIDSKLVHNMKQTMLRRGPDENGEYKSMQCCLIHSRLSIIDPYGGKQPMQFTWNQENYVITYNGELYNTKEVRNKLIKEGHYFHSYSDTEVVLHAYAQWGADALEYLNGIFAFAIWEEKRKRLFLARDRIGVKPLFYKLHENGLIFASEMKTILAYPSVKPELDTEGVAQLLLLGPGRCPGSGVFRGILELEPGCCGFYEEGKFKWYRYWKLIDREHRDTYDETRAIVRELVMDSIQRQMVSDVPIGTFLSGGLDSSIISSVCTLQKHKEGDKLQTFSLDYENNDKYFVPGKFQPASDTNYINIMQKYLDCDTHWTVLTPEDLMSNLEEATIARDLPGMADVDFSLLAFCKQIKNHVKVALSGECADEIFGGYPWYTDPEVRSIDGFPWAQNTKQRSSFLTEEFSLKIKAEEFIADQYRQTIVESDILPDTSPQERRMKQMVNLNHRWFMQTLLDRKDRMSMYCGLEIRVPFCDYRIAEYLYGVPWNLKYHGGYEKGLLRSAMEGILPAEILYRKKSPYPKTYDPKYFTLVSNMLRELLTQKDQPIFQIVKKEALEKLLNAEYIWPWYGQLMKVPQTIAYMLQLNFWLKHYHLEILTN